MARSLKSRLGALERAAGRNKEPEEANVDPTRSTQSTSVQPDGVDQLDPPASESSLGQSSLGQSNVNQSQLKQSDLFYGSDTKEGLAALGFTYEDDGEGGFWHRALSYDLLSYYGNVRYHDIMQRDLALLARACKVYLPIRPDSDNLTHPQGHLSSTLQQPSQPSPTLQSALTSQPSSLPASSTPWQPSRSTLSPDHLRFYDTETTGLGTGAGTFPFLHAVGQIEDDEWVIHQYFVDDFSEEPALLSAIVRRHFDENSFCVNFNGKSFDWPLFRNRLVMYRIELDHDVPQLDLLHPSRRLWRRKLERVNLGHLETAVMGMQRSDDLPGREAPARYFAYVNNREVEQIRPVLDHNAADVSALLGLTVVVADLLNGDTVAESAGEYAALAKWYDEWQEYDLAERCWVSATECPDASWREFWLTSLRYKRLGQWEEACTLWREMAQNFRWSTGPLVELAKYFEHRQRDYAAALEWTDLALERAMQLGDPADHVPFSTNPVILTLRHRRQRIAAKAARAQ